MVEACEGLQATDAGCRHGYALLSSLLLLLRRDFLFGLAVRTSPSVSMRMMTPLLFRLCHTAVHHTRGRHEGIRVALVWAASS